MNSKPEYVQPAKGQSTPLTVSQVGKHRIVIGLSWDKNEKARSWVSFQSQLLGSLKIMKKNPATARHFASNPDLLYQKDDQQGREKNDPNFDLDLSCFAFDKDGNFKDWVDPSAYNAIDDASKMYHSGEDMDGEGDIDDEQIHIELKNVEDTYAHFFVVVDSDCMHKISKVNGARVRVGDVQSYQTILETNLNQLEGSENYSFIFCHVFKKNDGWHVKNISEFVDENQNWPETLKKYL